MSPFRNFRCILAGALFVDVPASGRGSQIAENAALPSVLLGF